jgi:hypothetical protein
LLKIRRFCRHDPETTGSAAMQSVNPVTESYLQKYATGSTSTPTSIAVHSINTSLSISASPNQATAVVPSVFPTIYSSRPATASIATSDPFNTSLLDTPTLHNDTTISRYLLHNLFYTDPASSGLPLMDDVFLDNLIRFGPPPFQPESAL